MMTDGDRRSNVGKACRFGVCEASGGLVLGDQARSLITRRSDENEDIK